MLKRPDFHLSHRLDPNWVLYRAVELILSGDIRLDNWPPGTWFPRRNEIAEERFGGRGRGAELPSRRALQPGAGVDELRSDRGSRGQAAQIVFAEALKSPVRLHHLKVAIGKESFS
jgi:hypothetical protein